MILTCQSCAARYFTEDSSIGPNGRTVRCAACGHSWFVEGQLVLSTAAPVEDILKADGAPKAGAAAKVGAEGAAARGEPPVFQRRSAPQSTLTREQVERARASAGGPRLTSQVRLEQMERERKQRVRTAIGSWVGAGAAVAAAATGAVVFREDVARFWPESAAAFAMVGLDVNVFGLEFAELKVERTYEGPTPVLVVSGAVRNIGSEPRPVPALRLGLTDGAGKEVYARVAAIGGEAIAPGAALPFHLVIDNPPVQAADLEATFATPKEAAALEAVPSPKGPDGGSSEHGHDVPLAEPPPIAEAPSDEPLALAPHAAAESAPHADGPHADGAHAAEEALLLRSRTAPAEPRRAGPVAAKPAAHAPSTTAGEADPLPLRGPKGVG